jgi:glycosyltransferase involved in cell wall biosynthesis
MSVRRTRVLIVLPTFEPYDAIGNDALGMYQCFREAGYEASVFAQRIHEGYQSFARRVDREPESTWSCPEDILIYHHGIEWQFGEFLLFRAKSKIVIKYHNVTPPHFFKPYAADYFEGCKRGMEQTRRLARHPTAWFWGDSSYNISQLAAFGAPPGRSRVVPPCHRIQDLAAVPLDNSVLGKWRGSTVNLLFVGALRPNKGHCRAIDVLAAYRRLSATPARLFLAGNTDPHLSSYVEAVRGHARQLRVEQDVHFAFSVPPAQLRAYYLLASVFLCVSEHEGFCVPLVEAMSLRVPVIACDGTAIGETCADACMVLADFDAGRLAAAIDECIETPGFGRQLARQGRQRYENTFHPRRIDAQLLRLIQEVEQSA